MIEIAPKEYEVSLSFHESKMYCFLLSIDGKLGWRLPTIDELGTIRNRKQVNPACDLDDCTSLFYWSSTPTAVDSSTAWGIAFYGGSEVYDYKDFSFNVRCVRDSENGLEWSATAENKMNWDVAVEYARNLVAPVYYKDDLIKQGKKK